MAVIVTSLGVLVLATALVVSAVALPGPGRARPGDVVQPRPTLSSRPAPTGQPSALHRHTPATAVPGATPAQEDDDQLFARGLQAAPGLKALVALRVPRPAISGGWPVLPVAGSPQAWVAEFVPALVDVDFAQRSRSALAAWAQAEEAPELLPGMPVGAADKVLYVSLFEPGLAGGQGSPVPSAKHWATLARTRASQSVSGLLVQVDPGWAQLVASGWQPPDPRLDVLDVSGLLSTRRAGRRSGERRFSLAVAVGSALWHDGYGTVAVGDWQEG